MIYVFLEVLGLTVCILGSLLVIIWAADYCLTKWLRFTNSFRIFIRFAWLEGKVKQQMRADLEYEDRKRGEAVLFDDGPDPIDPSDYDEHGNVIENPPGQPSPAREGDCPPLTREVPLTTADTPVTVLMEAAAAAHEARQFSLPLGSDCDILDSDKTEATAPELSGAMAPPAREAEDIVDRCSLEIFEHLLAKGYMMPAEGLRTFVRFDLESLLGMLLTNTPRRSMDGTDGDP